MISRRKGDFAIVAAAATLQVAAAKTCRRFRSSSRARDLTQSACRRPKKRLSAEKRTISVPRSRRGMRRRGQSHRSDIHGHRGYRRDVAKILDTGRWVTRRTMQLRLRRPRIEVRQGSRYDSEQGSE